MRTFSHLPSSFQPNVLLKNLEISDEVKETISDRLDIKINALLNPVFYNESEEGWEIDNKPNLIFESREFAMLANTLWVIQPKLSYLEVLSMVRAAFSAIK